MSLPQRGPTTRASVTHIHPRSISLMAQSNESANCTGKQLGITCSDISAHALCTGGDIALRCAKVPRWTIPPFNWWINGNPGQCSSTSTNTIPFAQHMIAGGSYVSLNVMQHFLLTSTLWHLPICSKSHPGYSPLSHPRQPWSRIFQQGSRWPDTSLERKVRHQGTTSWAFCPLLLFYIHALHVLHYKLQEKEVNGKMDQQRELACNDHGWWYVCYNPNASYLSNDCRKSLFNDPWNVQLIKLTSLPSEGVFWKCLWCITPVWGI